MKNKNRKIYKLKIKLKNKIDWKKKSLINQKKNDRK